MTKDNLLIYYNFFNDLWKFFKNHNENQTDDDWQAVIDGADQLYKQYPGEFFKKAILLLLEEIERINKEDK